jgi:hypothetical protein
MMFDFLSWMFGMIIGGAILNIEWLYLTWKDKKDALV